MKYGTPEEIVNEYFQLFFRLLKNDTGKAILRVIAGPRAFKIILLARLTPIPFGLQNTIFGVSRKSNFCNHRNTQCMLG